jgi:DNA-binding response OmpR family regulator
MEMAKTISGELPRILLAEDDREMRHLLATLLRKDGYEVIESADGKVLLENLRSSRARGGDRYDLVITDIRMPGVTGLQVLAELREFDTTTPVVLITSFGDSETHETANRLGADAVFDKPFNVNDLRKYVERIAPRRSAHRTDRPESSDS